MLRLAACCSFLLLTAVTAAQEPAVATEAQADTATAEEDNDSIDLVRVFRCRFDDERDVNYDLWPDRWKRVLDDEHPRYARIEIEPPPHDATFAGRRLVIRPDGASSTAISPPIHVLPKFSYKLRVKCMLKGADNGSARVRLAFYSGDEVRQVEQSLPIENDGQWHDLDLGDFQPDDDKVDRLYVQFDFQRGERGDLDAEFSIADVRLFRLPSIKIHTDSRYNVYTDPSDVKVTCSLSGILEQNPEVRFQLLDATNKSIGDGGSIELEGKIISESRARASDIVDGYGSDKSSYEGEIDWRPPIRDYGFYRVRVGMYRAGTTIPVGDARTITVAVVREDLETSERGEFGWSLPRGDKPLSFSVLQELLPRVGVRMVKTPVWFAPGDEKRGDEILRFSEQLAVRGIETIGVLEDPSLQLSDPLSEATPPPIEGLLAADPSYWTPLIDHVITKLSLRIRWWQLGADSDTSFVGYNKLVERIGAIRNQMFRFGQDIRMGIGWRWDHSREWDEPLTWDFEQVAGRKQLDAMGLQAAFAAAPPSEVSRWVLVAPPEMEAVLPPGVDTKAADDPVRREAIVRHHQQRVRDFVEQILVAKMNGADGIFVSNPYSGSADAADGRTGVMNDDGTPGELLLPWRTCARLLGGASYLGSIRLPNNSNNWLFKRPDGKVVMVLWNLDASIDEKDGAPIEETLYLGERVQVVDIWGAIETPDNLGSRQVIRIGRMPRFVIGLDESVARWRMAAEFEQTEVPSVFGAEQRNAILMTNTFPQGVGGSVRVFVPSRHNADEAITTASAPEWEVAVDQERFSLPVGKKMKAPLSITLRDASFGPQLVRIDFEVVAERAYRFSVWRELSVGLEDVFVEVESFLGSDGRLVIEQRMRNDSGTPTDFKCSLYAVDRRRKRTQVFQLGSETDKKRYVYLNSEGLIGGEMRLFIEEVDGPRVLIHRFRVDPVPLPEEDDDSPLASR